MLSNRCPLFTLTGRTGRNFRFRHLQFYACEGMILLYDTRESCPRHKRFQTITPDDMKARVKQMAAYASYRTIEQADWQRQEQREVLRACQDFNECIREAKAMGDPTDPAVQAWWQRHNRKGPPLESLKSKSYPALPELPLGEFTGRTCTPDVIYKAPERKKKGGIVLHSDAVKSGEAPTSRTRLVDI